jgi:FkbM family methyltransferase
VGANAGFFTLWSIAQNPGLQASCFEPHPISAARLRKQIAANSADARITVVEAAAGSSSGRCSLNISSDSSMGIVSDSTHQLFENGTKVEVEITTLDSFALSKGFFPDLLKIDVEGFEVEVLKGAAKCLASAKYVILEYHSAQLRTECVNLLQNAGFQIESRGSILFAAKPAAKHRVEADHSKAAAFR